MANGMKFQAIKFRLRDKKLTRILTSVKQVLRYLESCWSMISRSKGKFNEVSLNFADSVRENFLYEFYFEETFRDTKMFELKIRLVISVNELLQLVFEFLT